MRMEELIIRDAKKIRKRGGCSPSSSASSALHNYRFKRAILATNNKTTHHSPSSRRGGSTTPLPTWRTRSPHPHPPAGTGTGTGTGRPKSARQLGASLWELNEVLISPKGEEDEGFMDKTTTTRRRRSHHNHLSDPSHTPTPTLSERMERSGSGSHRRRESSSSSITRRLKTQQFDTVSHASFMEIETRSRCQTPCAHSGGGRSRLKDVSNALTTSKELLKIISRMWGQEDQPSSSMSLISALHSELERARLQVNQFIHSDNKDIIDLLKRFAEEKVARKTKHQEEIESVVESISGELEVERKLRRRIESLNKKLGKELAETKASFLKVVKELENEKKARGIREQVCDELAGNIGEDKAQVADTKRETLRMQQETEIERKREMLHIAEAMREERSQIKITDAKHQFEEKNADVDRIRNQLEAYLKSNSSKENGHHNSIYHRRDIDLAFCRGEARESDRGEVEDSIEGENSAESDLHSIELNVLAPRNSKRVATVDEESKGRRSIFNQVARRSTSLLRSVSNIVEWGNSSNHETTDKQTGRRSCGDDVQRYKSGKGARDYTLSTSRLGLERETASPLGPPWPSREPCGTALQRHVTMEERLDEDKSRRL